MIVAPGPIVDQWQDELYEKFGIEVEILTREMTEAAIPGSTVFEQHPLLLARMDQLARSEAYRAGLEVCDWDLVVVDEAHRMSAQHYGAKLHKTLRYQLGQLLRSHTRHFLLMTATPHSGDPDAFQLFLALLDADRFAGSGRDRAQIRRPDDLMHRMVKEDLLTMDGKPLFPERYATTVPYTLSEAEAGLYQKVTQYFQDEMGRADRLDENDQRRRNVGFALTVLQRRLASSPEAILRSLERRRERLRRQLETESGVVVDEDVPLAGRFAQILSGDDANVDEAIDDLTSSEIEQLEETLIDHATAAQTQAELAMEIATLDRLVEVARQVRLSGTDRKWNELKRILTDHTLFTDERGQYRKLIVFTEHRDTLEYLCQRIVELIGVPGAVVTIHGSMQRDDRHKVQDLFTQDPTVRVLVATDAAGEGINLQRAHLMVNYDLPWNPNRIEQRFGRIHRIGQTEVCQLWNLVADNTREGNVYQHLLYKIEQQRQAYGGKVFDVLGDVFQDQSLRQLMIEAIRYGDLPEVRAKLETVINAAAGDGIEQLLNERALARDPLLASDVEEIQRQIEAAEVRRIQPHYLRAFFITAFNRLGGSIQRREAGRFEITRVPASIRDYYRQTSSRATVVTRYERVCFDKQFEHPAGGLRAQLLAPGHPLVDAVVGQTLASCAAALREGAVFVDGNDQSEIPRLLVALNEEIRDGSEHTVSKRFSFVEIYQSGSTRPGGSAPYLDYRGLSTEEVPLLGDLLNSAWLKRDAEEIAVDWAVRNSLPQHANEVQQRVSSRVGRIRSEVVDRLTSEISRWDAESVRLRALAATGQSLRPETAENRVRDLKARLAQRLAELDRDAALVVLPPVIAGSALVVPQGLLDKLCGQSLTRADTTVSKQRGVSAVLAAERHLGAVPEEMPPDNQAYDIRSVRPDGTVVHIKVIVHASGMDTFSMTRNDVIMAKNMDISYRLALVSLGVDPSQDELHYVVQPFNGADTDDLRSVSFSAAWSTVWTRGCDPM